MSHICDGQKIYENSMLGPSLRYYDRVISIAPGNILVERSNTKSLESPLILLEAMMQPAAILLLEAHRVSNPLLELPLPVSIKKFTSLNSLDSKFNFDRIFTWILKHIDDLFYFESTATLEGSPVGNAVFGYHRSALKVGHRE